MLAGRRQGRTQFPNGKVADDGAALGVEHNDNMNAYYHEYIRLMDILAWSCKRTDTTMMSEAPNCRFDCSSLHVRSRVGLAILRNRLSVVHQQESRNVLLH